MTKRKSPPKAKPIKKFAAAKVDGLFALIDGLTAFSLRVEQNAVAHKFRALHPKPNKELLGTATANLHGEVSELWESFRAGTLDAPCDKADKMEALGLPRLTSKAEELADIIIRALDNARSLKVDIVEALVVKHLYNTTRPVRHGGKLA